MRICAGGSGRRNRLERCGVPRRELDLGLMPKVQAPGFGRRGMPLKTCNGLNRLFSVLVNLLATNPA